MKKYVKHLIAIAVILIVACLLEIVIFDWQGLVHGYDEVVLTSAGGGDYSIT